MGKLSDKNCHTCEWYAEYEGVCCNGYSPYRADIREDGCDWWEKKKEHEYRPK